MTQRTGAYLHPWDLEWLSSLGGTAALRDMGCTDLAFPAAYHAGRWTTPVGKDGLVRFLEDGVVYFRPGKGYGGLRPQPAATVPATGSTPLADCIAAARENGLEAHAWTVLFHNSRLGRAHPSSCAHNALGDAYEYSLCPARPEVQEYGLQLVRETAAHPGLDVVELEALGFMGYRHGSHHDKTSFRLDRYLDFLLSFCFCEHCCAGLAEQGVDGAVLGADIARMLRRELVDADAMAPAGRSDAESGDQLREVLGESRFSAMLRHRVATYGNLLTRMRGVLPDGVRLSVHLALDPLHSGSQIAMPLEAARSLVDEVVVTHYGQSPAAMVECWKGLSAAGLRTRLAIWPKAPEFSSDADLAAVANLVDEAGLDGVRIYHLGLLPWKTTERVFAALGG